MRNPPHRPHNDLRDAQAVFFHIIISSYEERERKCLFKLQEHERGKKKTPSLFHIDFPHKNSLSVSNLKASNS